MKLSESGGSRTSRGNNNVNLHNAFVREKAFYQGLTWE